MSDSGKWSDPAFPRTGWGFLTGKDHGPRGQAICEVCEAQIARFAYFLGHDCGLLLWAGDCCASRLCPDRADAILATRRKLQDDADELASRTIAVEGTGYLLPGYWAANTFPFRSPLLAELFKFTRLTILSRPAPERVRVIWFGEDDMRQVMLCDQGEDVWLCAVVTYNAYSFNGSPSNAWPPCRFAAMVLRDQDMDAVFRLCGPRPGNHTLLLRLSSKPPLAEWVLAGAAAWKGSVPFIAERMRNVLSDDGRLVPKDILVTYREYMKRPPQDICDEDED